MKITYMENSLYCAPWQEKQTIDNVKSIEFSTDGKTVKALSENDYKLIKTKDIITIDQ